MCIYCAKVTTYFCYEFVKHLLYLGSKSKKMKSLTLVCLLCSAFFAQSQGVFTTQTHTALQAVVDDFPNRFKNIRGELLRDDVQTSDYTSRIEIPGALNTVITRYTSNRDTDIYSWKALLAGSEEFTEASRRYRELYRELKNSIIKMEGEKPFILNGVYEIPTEDKRFIVSKFYLLPRTEMLKDLRIELSMEYLMTEWKVFLHIYEQEESAMAME